ncbi:MAG: PAS domain S-box protein [Elusimicrobia bacterium]|nr:PAS domain S-box protein [Elusimicrobiota bacterium]
MLTKKFRFGSAWKLMAVLSLVFFFAETMVMFLLPLLPVLPNWLENMADATLMVLLSAPAVYFLIVRSMKQRIDELEPMSEKLTESDRLFREMAETVEEVFWITDPEKNTMLYISPAYQKIWGRTCESLFAAPRNWLEAIHPEDRQKVLQAALTKQSRGDYAEEYRIIRPDQSVRWIRDRAFPVKDSSGKVSRIVGVAEDITERIAAEKKFRTLLESSPDAVVVVDAEGRIVLVNTQTERLFGYTREELHGKILETLMPERFRAGHPGLRAGYDAQSPARPMGGNLELYALRKDGRELPVDVLLSPISTPEGPLFMSVIRDISERQALEAQLRQAQKMESVGRLAGGVAHDFNNLLTAINGYASLLMDALPKDDSKRQDVKEILVMGKRAAALTQQLLAFSRRQMLATKRVDLNEIVGGTVRMLKRLIGENIKLETRLAAHPCMVKVDAGQIEQVLINLAVNARDAMPDGGTLVIATKTVAMPDEFFRNRPSLKRGPLVELCVSDTGEGMNEAVLSRLFEPYFTTKEMGKGTGLGLSTVHGIIKQSMGEIEVESAPNKGTTFCIYLPETEAVTEGQASKKTGPAAIGGDEVVLLVEDEESVRRLVERVLKGSGYTVLAAANGREALKALEVRAKPVDLVITDVVMPGMNGRELAQEIASRNMSPRTLYISGYTDEAIVQHGVLEPGLAFLYKPFTTDALLRKMREVLDGPRDQAKA